MLSKLCNIFSRPGSETITSYYDEIRNSAHIFIFGVCGRSSTTAMQRLLNSTGQICIWGEPGDYLIDRISTAICYIKKKWSNQALNLAQKFSTRHFVKVTILSINYCMTHSDWSPMVRTLVEAFSEMWRPPEPLKRFGFKEIRVLDKARW